jgi:hypothetical protein
MSLRLHMHTHEGNRYGDDMSLGMLGPETRIFQLLDPMLLGIRLEIGS